MPTASDVAAYILEQKRALTTYEVNKLLYYCNGWSLAWDGHAIFEDRIEAWVHGPVVPTFFSEHRLRRRLFAGDVAGTPGRLTSEQRATIDAVVEFYGELGAEGLEGLSHREAPWIDARGDLGPSERSNAEISSEAMSAYFARLARFDSGKRIPEAAKQAAVMSLALSEEEVRGLEKHEAIEADAAERWLDSLCQPGS